MKKWEDIVKEKMEDPDKTLPESVFAEFRAHRSGKTAPVSKPHVPGWVLFPAAAAAGLALTLLLRTPSASIVSSQTAGIPESPVADMVNPDPTAFTLYAQHKTIPALASAAGTVSYSAGEVEEPEAAMTKAAEPFNEARSAHADQAESMPEQAGTAMSPSPGSPAARITSVPEATGISLSSTYTPQGSEIRTVHDMKIMPAVGTVAGGSLMAALLLPDCNGTSSFDKTMSIGTGSRPSGAVDLSDREYEADRYACADGPVADADGKFIKGEIVQSEDRLLETPTHHRPVSVLLSTSVPVSNRLSITTGLDYALYSSSFTYSISGEKKQLAHYVGLPVRLDWRLASNRWLDVYVGGGIEGDFCVAATMDEHSIKKDGFSMSLLGVGGIQFNASKRLGLFVEPEISWAIPSENRILMTYRTEHPLMFSVAGGIRINLLKI